jgi:hypothetical protein
LPQYLDLVRVLRTAESPDDRSEINDFQARMSPPQSFDYPGWNGRSLDAYPAARYLRQTTERRFNKLPAPIRSGVHAVVPGRGYPLVHESTLDKRAEHVIRNENRAAALHQEHDP